VEKNPFLFDVSARRERRRRSVARARRIVRARHVLFTAIAAAAVAGVAVAAVTRPDGRFRRGWVAFTPCQVQLVDAECGRVSVPEDPARPDGAHLSLRVVVLPAARHPVGALFYLTGGPGGAASDDVPEVDQLFGGVAADRDLVLVDQRGTGGSNRLSCPPTPLRVDQDAAVAAYVRRCFARLGPAARLYTSAVASDDLEAVRRAMHYGPVDVYGASYGGTLAQVFLQLHPRSVRTLVLDSASLLQTPVYAVQAANAERALRSVLARCVAQRPCGRAYPRSRVELARLLRRPARRVTAFGQPVTIDAAAVASTVEALTRDPGGVPLLPQDIHRAAVGDYVPLAEEYVDRVGSGLDPRTRLAMSFEILCSEPWARFGPLRTGTESYLAGVVEARARLFARVCRGVPKGVVPAGSDRVVRTTVPVLMLAGGADPQDPPANLRGWRALFPNGRLVVVPGGAHGVLEQGCLPVVVAEFVARGTAHGLDTRCVRLVQPPQFETPG
jgi:pimeloyl-ACP methyl ester carboxylesterase